MAKTLDSRTAYQRAVRTALITPDPSLAQLLEALPHIDPATVQRAHGGDDAWEWPMPPMLVRGRIPVVSYERSNGHFQLAVQSTVGVSHLRDPEMGLSAEDLDEFDLALAYAQNHWPGQLRTESWSEVVMLVGVQPETDGRLMLPFGAAVGLDCSVADAVTQADWHHAIQVVGTHPLEAAEVVGSRTGGIASWRGYHGLRTGCPWVVPWRGFCADCLSGLTAQGCPRCGWPIFGEPEWGPSLVPLPQPVRAALRIAGLERTVSILGRVNGASAKVTIRT